jgi:A/G-specific adenine glycosylase
VAAKTKAPASRKHDRVKLQQRVLSWFDEHRRSFPWRETRDPYRTFIAEVMLQQTQTGRVGPAYGQFLDRFPTLTSLAHAPAMEVIRAWRGLGYNRRAVELQKAAQAVEHDFGGVFPHEAKVLRRLPGLGEYSAAAIACFAFGAEIPVVDTNVRRTLSRVEFGRDPDEVAASDVHAAASSWLPAGEAYRWNQALMDIGAMVCRPEHPLCPKCPLKADCRYYAKGLWKKPRAPVRSGEPFKGSRREKRGGIVDHLREAAEEGITLASLAKVLHPDGGDHELGWLVELLGGLERDGLVEMTAGAKKGSPRGLVRLPR